MQALSSVEAVKALRDAPAAVSDYIVLDQETIDTFARLTGDRQWIHVYPVRAAAESPFGCTIAHGLLTLSMVTTAFTQCFSFPGRKMSVNYGFDKVRFTGAVPAGARVRGVFVLQRVEDVRPGEIRCFWQVEMQVENSERPAMAATWLVQMRY